MSNDAPRWSSSNMAGRQWAAHRRCCTDPQAMLPMRKIVLLTTPLCGWLRRLCRSARAFGRAHTRSTICSVHRCTASCCDGSSDARASTLRSGGSDGCPICCTPSSGGLAGLMPSHSSTRPAVAVLRIRKNGSMRSVPPAVPATSGSAAGATSDWVGDGGRTNAGALGHWPSIVVMTGRASDIMTRPQQCNEDSAQKRMAHKVSSSTVRRTSP
mmetsp:Transcript_26999/g.77560  ORF Transcript_26999/g.77560 Transcript_26999/m.77560 type:complete len:213 (-) Transcript_26999:822-1460(-)